MFLPLFIVFVITLIFNRISFLYIVKINKSRLSLVYVSIVSLVYVI